MCSGTRSRFLFICRIFISGVKNEAILLGEQVSFLIAEDGLKCQIQLLHFAVVSQDVHLIFQAVTCLPISLALRAVISTAEPEVEATEWP